MSFLYMKFTNKMTTTDQQFQSRNEPLKAIPKKYNSADNTKPSNVFLTFLMGKDDRLPYRHSWECVRSLRAGVPYRFFVTEEEENLLRNRFISNFKSKVSIIQNQVFQKFEDETGEKLEDNELMIFDFESCKIICYSTGSPIKFEGTVIPIRKAIPPESLEFDMSRDFTHQPINPISGNEDNVLSSPAFHQHILTDNVEYSSDRKTVTVAIIDSGIDYDAHDCLKALDWKPNDSNFVGCTKFSMTVPGESISEEERVYVDDEGISFYKTSSPKDLNGHGTHIAGIIAGFAENSVSPSHEIGFPYEDIDLKLMNLKVGDESFNLCRVIAAIHFAIENKADVINLSLGYYSEELSNDSKIADSFYQAIKRAISENIVVVTSAGNGGVNTDFSEMTHYPSAFVKDLNNNFLSVTATKGGNTPNRLSGYSNFGKSTVNIAAAGNFILSTYKDRGNDEKGKWKEISGTSMAAAQISRVAAKVIGSFRNSNIEPTLAEIIDAIKLDGTYLETPYRDLVQFERTVSL